MYDQQLQVVHPRLSLVGGLRPQSTQEMALSGRRRTAAPGMQGRPADGLWWPSSASFSRCSCGSIRPREFKRIGGKHE